MGIYTLKRKNFNEIGKILEKNIWLIDKFEQLMQLLYSDCKTIDERDLIINMIERVYYMSTLEYKESINIIADDIVTNCKMQDTIIYALAIDRTSDSSNVITYDLKVALAERGWLKSRVYSTMNKLKDIQENDTIYLVDEFVGSGQTLKGRYEYLHRHMKEQKYQNKVNMFSIVAMKHAIKYLEDNNINLHSVVDLEKGISDYYDVSELDTKVKVLEDLEKRVLSVKYLDEDMYTLGYNNSETLFKREGGNTPNNVFPIFWWPETIDGHLRENIMVRAL